ncbi:MAG: hypothetical protein E6623_00205 [Clostridium perfringens]|uniref:hypothetical protein n=3 Tax=Clostridium perfringens TaxID=1502 RepID=UPI000D712870|nr:hypothetical protein [Clostridium perfringens]EHA1005736.1 hypothetical protein [Clostridium perfringens]EHA1008716.1 hypothetical protein [Clostridium perfringens]EHA1020706.1 hypothetical protein [Clostridium perfringens]EIF2086362.1 hypothetical protein [Clostridium perfringens]EIF6154256.1 hypothetical protein [Clostridium perfringens]
MDIKIKIFWIVSILTGIIFIYMLSNIIFKLKLRKKIGRKSILKIISIIIGGYLIFLFFTIFNVYNYYNLKNIVEHSSMSKYIKDYKLSGTDYCVVTINGDEVFEKLDNKTKLEDMFELKIRCNSAIANTLFDGRIPYNIYHETKIIISIDDNNYVLYNTEKGGINKLFLNDELVYEENLKEIFSDLSFDNK